MTFNAMRIARPVTDLSLSSSMYCTGLGLEQIAQFADHAGFSGVMIGRGDLGWHLEFTLCHHHPVKPSPSEEDLLVLYLSAHRRMAGTVRENADRRLYTGQRV